MYLSDQLPITLAAANNPAAYYGPLTGSWCYSCLLSTTFPRGYDESDIGVYWDTKARSYVEAHKTRAAEVAAARMGLVWSVYAPLRQVQQDFLEGWPKPVADAWLIWFYPLTLLGIVGAVILRRRHEPIFPLVAMVVVPSVAGVLTYGNQRFRCEAEVAIVVLAAVTLDALWTALVGRAPEEVLDLPHRRLGDADRPVARPSEGATV